MAEPTPTTLEEFTPAWLTEQLRTSNTIGADSTVIQVERRILGEGEGFMGIVARLSLSYEGPAGPATVIAKIRPSMFRLRRCIPPSTKRWAMSTSSRTR